MSAWQEIRVAAYPSQGCHAGRKFRHLTGTWTTSFLFLDEKKRSKEKSWHKLTRTVGLWLVTALVSVAERTVVAHYTMYDHPSVLRQNRSAAELGDRKEPISAEMVWLRHLINGWKVFIFLYYGCRLIVYFLEKPYVQHHSS